MKRNASLTALSVVMLLVLTAAHAQPSVWKTAARFTVHPETTYQTVTGFGAGFNGGAEQLMETIKSQQDRAKAYDLLYGEAGARLNIIRLTISPLAAPVCARTPTDRRPSSPCVPREPARAQCRRPDSWPFSIVVRPGAARLPL